MIPDRLRAIESDLRKAVARRQYGSVTTRLEEIRRIADEYFAELPAGDPLRREIAHWVLDTIEWARLMVTTQRQALSNELARLPRIATYTASRYQGHIGRRTSAVCVDL
jgi:hypothetical protein